MSLVAGQRLGPYEIVGFLGAGGMGEVYGATDMRLKRQVAIKVLPVEQSARAERRERFELEARAISRLSHPNICSLYDIGEHAGARYLVMERLEGETLSARLKRGALPVGQALRIAIQAGEAIEHAHRRGLLHRDLKPENIMLTGHKGETVKLVDFGLAKMTAETPSQAGAAGGSSSTETRPLTSEGAVVGTFQYLAPELLEGKEASASTDIFAFGAVVYQMLTGRRAFDGQSRASLIASILKDHPQPISAVQPSSSPALDWTINKCLAKDPEDRWHSVRDLIDQLKWILESGTEATEARGRGRKSGWAGRLAIAAALTGGILVGGLIVAAAYLGRTAAPAAQTRFEVRLPDKGSLGVFDFPVLSPNGARVVFAANTAGGVRRLWLRRLDSLEFRELPGTEDAAFPFWSPDNRWIGFFAGGKLKKIDITGGSPVTLADAPGGIGGSWNRDGVILFCPKLDSALQRVNDSGGVPVDATRLDAAHHQTSQFFPEFLPDGRRFILYGISAGREDEFNAAYVGSLDSADVSPMFRTMGRVMYDERGYLVFARGDRLMAQPFDAKRLRLTGQPSLVVERVGNLGAVLGSAFTVAGGSLAYRAGENSMPALTWVNRKGEKVSNLAEPGDYGDIAVSPDGRTAAADYRESSAQPRSLWLLDLVHNSKSRLTFNATDDFNPSWSPDGKHILFSSSRRGVRDLYEKSADGTGPERTVFKWPQEKNLEDWSPDGKYVLFNTRAPDHPIEIWALPLSGDRKPFRVAAGRDSCEQGQFSPDGKWVAYRSFETGRAEIFVQDFPPAGGKWQISTAGGSEPEWRRDGKELFYFEGTKLMAVDIKAARGQFGSGVPHPLFDARIHTAGRNSYAVSPDGLKFLMNIAPAETSATGFIVMTGWMNGQKL